MKESDPPILLVLGTGGTLAGRADRAGDGVGYRAGQIEVSDLIRDLPLPDDLTRRFRIACEQLCQIDSKDASHEFWRSLCLILDARLADSRVAAVVVTHGTDTLEETAYFVERVLAPSKPVVFTAAMRPATALSADGPRNLADALCVAASGSFPGVTAVLAGSVHPAAGVRKAHSYRLDAFSSGDAGPAGVVEEGQVRRFREPARNAPLGVVRIAVDADEWPRIEIVTSHGGAHSGVLEAAALAGADGIIVAGTGNGTVHGELERAMDAARDAGVVCWRSSRCAFGVVVGDAGNPQDPVADGLPAGPAPRPGDLSPVQARIELLLRLLGRREHHG